MDDPGLSPVTVEMNGQAAKLLVKLMGDLQTDQPMAVLTRAMNASTTSRSSWRRP